MTTRFDFVVEEQSVVGAPRILSQAGGFGLAAARSVGRLMACMPLTLSQMTPALLSVPVLPLLPTTFMSLSRLAQRRWRAQQP